MASTTAVTSLSGVTTGTGDTVDFEAAVSHVSMLVVVTGTVTDGLVLMQASHNGTDWATIRSAHPLTAANFPCDFSGGAYRYWRAVVLDEIVGGGSVTVTFMEAG